MVRFWTPKAQRDAAATSGEVPGAGLQMVRTLIVLTDPRAPAVYTGLKVPLQVARAARVQPCDYYYLAHRWHGTFPCFSHFSRNHGGCCASNLNGICTRFDSLLPMPSELGCLFPSQIRSDHSKAGQIRSFQSARMHTSDLSTPISSARRPWVLPSYIRSPQLTSPGAVGVPRHSHHLDLLMF